MLGFNGGLIGVRRVSTTASASGLWSQNEQVTLQRAGIWPLGPSSINSARYWRIKNLTGITNVDYFEIAEIQLLTPSNTIASAGITPTASNSVIGGSLGAITDSDLTNFAQWNKATAINSGFYIQFDLGSNYPITQIKVAPAFTISRSFTGATIAYSNDGVTFTNLLPFTGITYTTWTTLSNAVSINNP